MATASKIMYGISPEIDISVQKQKNKIAKEEDWEKSV
jgi:hypothetical protein